MMSQTEQQINAMHILSNISRSKDDQTMKFSQLIEYKVRNIFLGKPYPKCGVEASPKFFYIKSNFSITLDQQSEMF